MLSDKSLNLANINTDLQSLTDRIAAITGQAESVLDTIAGPTERKDNPVKSNSSSVAMISQLYDSLKALESLTNRIDNASTELNNVINGVSTVIEPEPLTGTAQSVPRTSQVFLSE